MHTTHIHQGGTLNTFCGAPLAPGAVGWEQAEQASCDACRAFFA